jgi:hypothetical protein
MKNLRKMYTYLALSMAIALSSVLWHASRAYVDHRFLEVGPAGSKEALGWSLDLRLQMAECAALLGIAVSQGVVILWLRKTLGKRIA